MYLKTGIFDGLESNSSKLSLVAALSSICFVHSLLVKYHTPWNTELKGFLL